jgi:queuine tRNA-ribosyltransferase
MPLVPALSILARDPASRARAGVLRTAHGEVRTPAFVPLATKGSVRGLNAAEISALGFDMVLGNTYHLFVNPGPERIAAAGDLHGFMSWDRALITDSGGFQVFSMGHGSVAEEIKGRRGGGDARGRDGAVLSINEDGVLFRSYIDGEDRFLGPETSMAVQAALGSDLVLAFDECTPFHVDRSYTARSTERTHRWLERCLAWRAEHAAGDGSLFYGIVQGGVHEDLRRESTQVMADAALDGIAIGGSLGEEKAQMYEVVGWSTAELDRVPERPRHLLGIGDIDDLIAGVELGIDTFDCAMPTRLARHGVAVVPEPAARWRVQLEKSPWREAAEPLMEDCPCPACAGGLSRAYLHYLVRNKELTGARLLTLHNLSFVAATMTALREAVLAGELARVAADLRAGVSPYCCQPPT